MRRVKAANLTWPLPADLDDEALEQKLYPLSNRKVAEDIGELDWVKVNEEMKRKNVTLMLLWNEYRENYPKGIGYSQFCDLYRQWKKQLDVWMHQDHKAGEKMFVDYAGDTIPIYDEKGGIHKAQIFVAVLGASGYVYAEATMTQSLPDWIESHRRALEFFGDVPELSIPDNTKSCTILADRYEPKLNLTYLDFANHYGLAIMPARVRSPQDKSLAEKGVQIVQYKIVTGVRDLKFFYLAELNGAIIPLLAKINSQKYQKLPYSRLDMFEKLDKPALKPLPSTPCEYAEWSKAKAGLDYHIEFDEHHYSIPYTFIKKPLDVRSTNRIIEIFNKSKRIAVHERKYTSGYTTLTEHMPKSHQEYAKYTPEQIIKWAKTIGIATHQLVEKIVATTAHPHLGFRACLGILRLSKSYTEARLEAACSRALKIKAYSYKSIVSILKNNLDQVPVKKSQELTVTKKTHENIRGGDYFE